MQLAASRRKHIRWNISQDPTTITIKRVTKTRKGGGYEDVETTLSPITVRIFTDRSGLPKDISTKAGTKQTDTVYSLLADDQANIQSDTITTDSFAAKGQNFQVIAVWPQIVLGELVGYQVDLERVN